MRAKIEISEIEYANDLIVIFKWRDSFVFFCDYMDQWYLNYKVWNDNADHKFKIHDFSFRGGLEVLDESNFASYMDFNKENIIGDDGVFAIQKKLKENGNPRGHRAPEADVVKYLPSIYADMEAKVVYNYFYEDVAFEKYIPHGWSGFRENFFHRIPDKQKYWIIDGIDYSDHTNSL